LAYPDPGKQFILDTDASETSIGAELLQIHDEKEYVVSYASKILTPAQKRYCTTRRELLAIITFTRQFRNYLLGRQFIIRTDHSSLTWLLRFKCIEGQLARWLEELSQYDVVIQHRPGNKHTNADGLSRIPDTIDVCNNYVSGATIENLPCGGCAYCSRAQRTWGQFESEVDDVIPLSVRNITEDRINANPLNGCNWLEGGSTKDVAAEQRKDPDLQKVIQWLETDVAPSEFELQMSSTTTKHWWTCKSQLKFKEGTLVYEWKNSNLLKLLILIPRSLQEQVLKSCHDTKLSGHFGQQKTFSRVKSKFIWHGMRQDTLDHVRTCAVCNINKKSNRKAKGPLGQFHAGAPMERVHMDILGPLKESKRGNKYILVVIDQFTKWVEFYALPNQTAQTISSIFVDNFVSKFGCPSMIHTDQGKNFDGILFHEVCKLLEITKTRTTPYRPCNNGQVERYNSIILQCIRCFLKGKQEDWDLNLQLLAGAIRSTENRNTGYTANMLMFGRETQHPIDLLLGTPQILTEKNSTSEYVKNLRQILEEVHSNARKNIQSAQRRQKRVADTKLFQNTFRVGDAVYRVDDASKVGESKQLRNPWQGPYIVINVLSPVLYEIQKRKKVFVVHHDKLKSCNDRVLPNWLLHTRRRLLHDETTGVDDSFLHDSDISQDLTALFIGEGLFEPASNIDEDIDNGAMKIYDWSGTVESPTRKAPSTCSNPSAITGCSGVERFEHSNRVVSNLENLHAITNDELNETFLYNIDHTEVETQHEPRARLRKRPRHLEDYVLFPDNIANECPVQDVSLRDREQPVNNSGSSGSVYSSVTPTGTVGLCPFCLTGNGQKECKHNYRVVSDLNDSFRDSDLDETFLYDVENQKDVGTMKGPKYLDNHDMPSDD